MEKIKKYLNVLIWPVVFIIGQFFILFVLGIILKLINNDIDIASFINNNSYLVSIFNLIIFLPFFLKVYKKYKDKYNDNLKDIPKIIIFGVLLSYVLNSIIYLIKMFLNINIVNFDLNIFYVINIALVGPILEEYLFRGIVFNKLLGFNSEKKAYFISVIIFALFHTGGILNIIYAFIMGLILTKLYINYKNINENIIFHIAINTTSSLLFPLLLNIMI